jgi:quinoprotein glucose dehydrogenase
MIVPHPDDPAFALPTFEIDAICVRNLLMPCSQILAFLFAILTILAPSVSMAQDEGSSNSAPAELEFSRWSGDVNVPDPVAISFDNRGRAFVTQTARRKIQDLDIRAFREWISDDVGFQSVADKRAFYRRMLAPAADGKSRGNPKIEDLNGDGSHDFRDLMVISEKIHLIEDTNGDGIADRTSVFAEDFKTEVTGIAAGVLWHDGNVYSTIAPDVWKLRDTNDDGKADQREVIATGFGLHIAYGGHDMHGLTVGPDGKVYWTVGDKGISVTSKEGRRFHYPNQGGVMRCNPDGSDFEVFAHGLRNVQELAFDQYGNLFGVDNDADQPGERERFVYIVEGMDAGWRCNYQYRSSGYNPWTEEKLWVTWHEGQPAYIVPPISHSLNGPAGFAFNPGTALSPEYKDYFFLTGAPGGEQRAFQVKPSGASFEMINEHEIGRGIPLVGINFAPDGALYGVDWGGGYPLNQKGAVWKIDVPDAANSERRTGTQQLLTEGFANWETVKLIDHLAHADQRVRFGCQFELVRRRVSAELQSVARNSETQISRIHAVWALGQLARSKDSEIDVAAIHKTFVELLSNKDSELRAQVARTVSDLDQFDGARLVPLLNDPEPRVQFRSSGNNSESRRCLHATCGFAGNERRAFIKHTQDAGYSRFAVGKTGRCDRAASPD